MHSRLISSRRPAARGFTLIELLTVIAIIGILAAIIIPTVGRVRQTARTSASASNLRQLALATQLYAQDNKNRLPPANYVPPSGTRLVWDLSIQPYLVNSDNRNAIAAIFLHPGDNLVRGDVSRPPRSYSAVSSNTAADAVFSRSSDIGTLLSVIRAPSATFLLTERVVASNALHDVWAADVRGPNEQTATPEALALNGGKFNYAFVDGHVELLAIDAKIGTAAGGSLAAPKGAWTVRDDD